MGQEILKIEDIVGGDNLVKKQELDEFLKKNEVGTAASKDEDYFAKSDEVPPLPQYTIEIKREDIVWTDDYITIPHSTYLRDKKIEIHKALLRKGSGDIVLNPRVSYPRSETYNSAPPNEFYLKDGDGYITRGNDFEYLYLEYSVLPSLELNNYDLRNGIGRSVVQDENSGQTVHSSMMKKVFDSIFPDLWEEYGISCIESIKDPLSGGGYISASFEPKFMELKEANMLFRPYLNGASSEQIGSNPNILKVGSHYGNWGQFGSQQERDLTPADDIFLTNSIAVAARGDFEAANTEYVPDIPGDVGRYGWTKSGWTGDFETGFTHTPGNTSPLSRPCFIRFTTSEVRKYWVDFVVTGRTAGSFTVSLNLQESSPYTESGRFELITTSLDGRVLTITPTSDFDGKISVRCNRVLNQSSFGRGLEFSEDINKGEIMDSPIPDSWNAYAMVCTNEDGSIVKSTVDTSGNPYNPDWTEKFEVGDVVEIRTNPVQTVEVAEILGVNSIRITTPITPIINAANNPYLWRFTTDQTLHSITGYGQQQSPTCSIVGAKLKKIELLTGANLQIVREAARMTAKKTVNGVFGNHPGHWDKYRGFGQIYPDDAIQYIKDNYTENPAYLKSLSSEAERVHGINPTLKYDDISDNTPVTKKMLEDRLQIFLEQLNL